MAHEIVVKFRSGGREHRAVVRPGGKVTAVFLPAGSTRAFLKKTGLTKRRGVPPGVKILDEAGNNVTHRFADRLGPRVCYMVGFQLICW